MSKSEMPFTIQRKRSGWVVTFRGKEYGKISHLSEEGMDQLLVALNAAYWRGYVEGRLRETENPAMKAHLEALRDSYAV